MASHSASVSSSVKKSFLSAFITDSSTPQKTTSVSDRNVNSTTVAPGAFVETCEGRNLNSQSKLAQAFGPSSLTLSEIRIKLIHSYFTHQPGVKYELYPK